MAYTPKTFVARRGDDLAVKALRILERLDPVRVTTLTVDNERLSTVDPKAVVALFTFGGMNGQVVKYPGNHLRVLRNDDRSRPLVRRFEPPAWTQQPGQSIPVHQCVALRPRAEGESDQLLAEALRSAYNELTNAKVKAKPAPVGYGAPPKVPGTTRRDSAHPPIMGVR